MAAYVLGGLTDVEHRRMARHVDGCPSCARQGRAFGRVIEALALAVPPVPPPAGLRNRVRAAVAAEQRHATKTRP